MIPFVSSLSDDIINAVPQAMRDGSYGLGATQSETIRQVILRRMIVERLYAIGRIRICESVNHESANHESANR